MCSLATKRILIVEDYASIRETMARLLVSAGYEVSEAEHGFSALLQLRRDVPDLILSDLNMPQMSGFEFLSVIRRRFPKVLVIAMSGDYGAADAVPGGLIAEAFYAKGQNKPEVLLKLIADLFQSSAPQVVARTRPSAPVWIPRNGKDSQGVPYIVLTCTECLRSFPLNVTQDVAPTVLTTPCIFCLNEVRYIIDFSLAMASPPKEIAELASIARRATG